MSVYFEKQIDGALNINYSSIMFIHFIWNKHKNKWIMDIFISKLI